MCMTWLLLLLSLSLIEVAVCFVVVVGVVVVADVVDVASVAIAVVVVVVPIVYPVSLSSSPSRRINEAISVRQVICRSSNLIIIISEPGATPKFPSLSEVRIEHVSYHVGY